MKKLLIVYYSYTGGTRQMAEACFDAARGEDNCEPKMLQAEDCLPDDILAADGYIFATPENLAAIAGVMKAFFDRCYYPLLGRIEGRPYAAMICAGSDGENAKRQLERIATGWRLKKVIDTLVICTHAQTSEEILADKSIDESDLSSCRKLGATLAAGLAMGVF
ncbi:flavodoxin family protein [Parasphingorhabdus halotolerans]|uniref:Flavodoxin family protein n=1 Tax=Parasphingorhabdus halotolerans TaxID=2725558 RepID=A0A6H2DQR5_9SPHN|nr:NAD(P)H-dependent oxidoreductase [Parasphingorhabdus halotolerans]QJB70323.1 flavodoxin family protein [Parasphingorhabdus halotolerans]